MQSLPEQFQQDRLAAIIGSSLFPQVLKTFVQRPTSFRVNSIKTKKQESKKALDEFGFRVKGVSWYTDAFILLNKTKRDLMELPLYAEGKIYIQSLASMVPPLVLDPKPGDKVLDLTAAPGSKTSQIAALMNREGELVANDNNKVRFFKLKHNMEALGVVDEPHPGPRPTESRQNGSVGLASGRALLLGEGKSQWKFTLRMEHGAGLCREYPEYFDKILVDAPCSAEARFIQGEPKTYGYWSERKIKEMAYKQRQLILSAWGALKPGGTLVYSTCTFAPEENEALISLIIDRFPDSVEVLPIELSGIKILQPVMEWKGRKFHPDVQKAIRILPTNEIEGFFVAKLRKKKSRAPT